MRWWDLVSINQLGKNYALCLTHISKNYAGYVYLCICCRMYIPLSPDQLLNFPEIPFWSISIQDKLRDKVKCWLRLRMFPLWCHCSITVMSQGGFSMLARLVDKCRYSTFTESVIPWGSSLNEYCQLSHKSYGILVVYTDSHIGFFWNVWAIGYAKPSKGSKLHWKDV